MFEINRPGGVINKPWGLNGGFTVRILWCRSLSAAVFLCCCGFVNFFPDNLASTRQEKKTTSLCYRPINLPRFSTNPPKSFKFYEERLRVCFDVIVGYQFYATVTQTSFEVLAENGAWIMSEACVVFSCCIAAEENFTINQLLNSKSWHYVEPTSRETKRKATANAWRQRTIKSYIFTTDWSSRWNNTK